MAFLIEGAALTAEAPYSSLFSMLLHITAAQRAKPTETTFNNNDVSGPIEHTWWVDVWLIDNIDTQRSNGGMQPWNQTYIKTTDPELIFT